MDLASLLSIRISDLASLDEDALTEHYRNFVDVRVARAVHGPRDDDYFHVLMMQAVTLLLLAKEHGRWKAYSFLDVRGFALDYFERANAGPLNDGEPRRFLEFLLDCKQQHDVLENDIDTLLTDIVDRCPGLGTANFSDDPAWFDRFVRFAKGLRHRSLVYAHGKPVLHYQLTAKMKDLYYDELANLIGLLAEDIRDDADADAARGRAKLSAALTDAAGQLESAAAAFARAWQHCKPFIDQTRKQGGLEHVFDDQAVEDARIGRFVRSYLMTLRMRGDFDGDVHYLSLLDGMNYRQQLAADPSFEAKIDALIDALEIVTDADAAAIERALNAKIGRDVWTCQSDNSG